MTTLPDRDKYKILLVEDNLIDRKLIHEFMDHSKLTKFELKDADRLKSALQLLNDEPFDAVLLDLFLPDAGKLEALDDIIDCNADIPVVILTGLGDEDLGISAVRRGAQDYLVKGDFERLLLIRSVAYAIERKKAEIALSESEKKYRLLFETTKEGIITSDSEGKILDANPAAADILGYKSPEELKGANMNEFYEDQAQRIEVYRKLKMEGFIDTLEIQGKKKDGTYIYALASLFAHKDKKDEIIRVDGIFRDITARKHAEELLKQKTHDLKERVKEINCLFGVSQLTSDPRRPLETILQQILELISHAWQYPEITYSKIEFKDKIFKTKNYQKTPWFQATDIIVSGERKGKIEVGYLKEMPIIFEGPFLKEERDLIYALARQIENFSERIEADEELHKSEAKYRQLVDNLNEIIFMLTPEGIISSINPAFEKITDWGREEFINTPFMRLVHPDDLHVLIERFEAYPLALQPETFEVRIKTKSGQPLVVEGAVTPQFENEKIIGFFGVAHDITERKQAENDLLKAKTRLEYLLTSNPAMIYACEPRVEYQTIYMSENVKKITGYETQDFVGKPNFWVENLHPEDRQQVTDKFSRINETGYFNEVYRFRHKGGTYRWMHEEANVIQDEQGNPVEIVGYWTDITPQKKAEEALHKSEKKYHNLITTLREGIWVIDQDAYTTFVNPSMSKILGYTEEEMIGQHLFSFMDEQGVKKAKKKLERREQGIEEQHDFEFTRKDGTRIFTTLETSPITDDSGNYLGALAGVMDITQRKQAEEALQESEEKYRSFIENFQGIAYREYQDFSADFFTGKVEEITGYTEDDFVSGRVLFTQLIHQEDLAQTKHDVEGFMSSSRETAQREYRIIDKNGKIHWIQDNIQKFYDEQNELSGVYGTIQDITDRKNSEKALKQSEEKYRLFFESTPIGIGIADLEGNILEFNQTMLEMIGYDAVEIKKLILSDTYVNPEDRKRLIQALQKSVEVKDFEVQLKRKDGTVYACLLNVVLMELEGKSVVLTTARDLTQWRELERAKSVREEEYRALFENVPIGLYRSALDGRIITANSAFLEMIGYTSFEELSLQNMEEISSNLGYSRELFIATINKEGIAKGLEQQIKRPDGSVIYIRENARAVKDISGSVIYYEGSFENITIEKDFEKVLKESEEKYRTLFTFAPIGIGFTDFDGKFLAWNTKLLEITSYSESEIFNVKFSEIFHNSDDHQLLLKSLSNNRRVQDWEVQLKRKDGSAYFAVLDIELIEFVEEETLHITLRDITEHKQAEEALRQKEKKYRDLISNISDGVVEMNIEGNFIFLSPQTFNLLGYHPEEVIGTNGFDLIHPDDIENAIEALEKALTGVHVFDFEYRGRHKDGHYVDLSASGKIIGEEEEGSKVFLVIKNITERKKAETALRESEERFRRLSEASFEGIVIHDEGRIIDVNQKFLKMFGYSEAEIKEIDGFSLIIPQQQKEIRKYVISGYEGPYEAQALKKDGSFCPVEVHAKIIPYKNQMVRVASMRDLTVRKQAKEALIQSEEKYRILFESASDLIMLIDPSGRIVDCNNAVDAVIGLSKEEIVGKLFTETGMILEEDIAKYSDLLSDVLSGLKVRSIEAKAVNRKGRIQYFELFPSLFMRDNEILAIQVIIHDVTERKQAEKALQKSEKKYRDLITNITDVVVEIDSEVKFIFVSPQVFDTLGYQPEELIGRSGLDLIHPDDLEDVLVHAETIVSGERVPNFEYRIKHKKGYYVSLSATSKLVVVEEENKIVSVLRNISERIKAENEMKRASELLEKTFASLDSAVFVLDSGNPPDILDCNPAACQIFGYKKQEMLNRPTTFLHVNKKIFSEFQKILYPQIEQEGFLSDFEFKMKRKNDKVFPSEHYVNQLLDDGNNRIGWISVVRDITKRKEAEERLRESEVRFQTLFESSPDGIVLTDLLGNITTINKPGADMLGYKDVQSLIGTSSFELIDQEDQELALRNLKQTLEVGRTTSLEYSVVKKDGTKFPVEMNTILLRDTLENPQHFMATVRDITERKVSEQALRESELKYRTILDSIGEGYYEVDLTGTFTFFNNSLCKLLGLSSSELMGLNYKEFGDDIATKSVFESFNGVYRTGIPTKIVDWEVTRKDGIQRFIEMSISLMKNSAGKPIGFRGIVIDVTEQKQAEQALKESEERFRKIFEEGPLGMTLIRPDRSYLGINNAFCEMVGYSEQELMNLTFPDITHPDDAKRDVINVEKLLKGEMTRYQTEKQYIKKNGDAFWGHTTVSLIHGNKGEPLHYIAMVEDISQRKQAEEEMRKHLMKFNIDDGNLYLTKEETPSLSHRVFTDLIHIGYRGLALSRTPEKEFKEDFDVEFEFRWFSEAGRKKSISPNFEEIEKVSNDLLGKSVILIDRLDYLVSKNGFKETLKFVYRLNEIAYLKNLVVILSLDPTILPNHNIRSLEKETKEIEPRVLVKVPDEMLEILRIVYQQNNLGIKPSFTDIGNELEISKPTARKRLKNLVATGYLNEQKSGNRKILELTEKGLMLFKA